MLRVIIVPFFLRQGYVDRVTLFSFAPKRSLDAVCVELPLEARRSPRRKNKWCALHRAISSMYVPICMFSRDVMDARATIEVYLFLAKMVSE